MSESRQEEAWEFRLDGASKWRWRIVDPQSGRELKKAADSFATLIECIADARAHGYERAD